jgi:hypothetical protein
MAVKIKSKGTVLAMEISSVYTAIPQLKSISLSGEKSETFDTTTLDGIACKTKAPTGYVDPHSISADGFYDPDDTVMLAFLALILTPVVTNFKVTYTDTTPTSKIYSGAGFGADITVAMADGVGISYSIECSGAPS